MVASKKDHRVSYLVGLLLPVRDAAVETGGQSPIPLPPLFECWDYRCANKCGFMWCLGWRQGLRHVVQSALPTSLEAQVRVGYFKVTFLSIRNRETKEEKNHHPHPHPHQGIASQQPTLYQGERRGLVQGKLYAKGNCSFGENGYLFYLSWCLKSSESNLVSVSLHRILKRMPPL